MPATTATPRQVKMLLWSAPVFELCQGRKASAISVRSQRHVSDDVKVVTAIANVRDVITGDEWVQYFVDTNLTLRISLA